MSDIESRLQVLEARIQEIEDDKAIRELIARYGYNADQGRGEAYVNLFTEDGVLNLSMGPGVPAAIQEKAEKSSEPDPVDTVLEIITGSEGHSAKLRKEMENSEVVLRFEGHEKLRRFITRPKHKSIKGMLLHVMGNNMTTHIDGDNAIAESYNFVLMRRGAEFVVMNAAANRWTLRKINGRWRIKEWMLRRPGDEDFGKVHVTME